jgi:uncharacterized protein (DUF433 family)
VFLITFQDRRTQHFLITHPVLVSTDPFPVAELVEVFQEMLGRLVGVGTEEIPVEAEEGHGEAIQSSKVGKMLLQGSFNFDIMEIMPRITIEPGKMGGRPCIRGMRITVGTIIDLLAAKRTREEILSLYSYLEDEDITAALNYASLLANDQDLPIERA